MDRSALLHAQNLSLAETTQFLATKTKSTPWRSPKPPVSARIRLAQTGNTRSNDIGLAMEDPLSTTASLIAAGQVLASIIVSCCSFQKSIKNAHENTPRNLLETKALRNVFESLLTQVTEDESSSGTALTSFSRMIDGDGSLLKICYKDLVTLEKGLQSPVSRWKRLGGRLLRLLRENVIPRGRKCTSNEKYHRDRTLPQPHCVPGYFTV